MTNNLRQFAKVDHYKMLTLKIDTLQYLELLGEIRSVGENLRTSVKGISKYLGGLAKYDEGIAKVDVTFISDKLTEFSQESDEISKKLETDVENAMTAMISILSVKLVEKLS